MASSDTKEDTELYIPPAYAMYPLKPDAGPKFVLIKPIFGSYKLVEVDKETFLSNYHSQFTGDYDWLGMVDDGLYDHLKSMNKRNLIPFSRWFKRRSARKYIIACKGWGRVRADHMEDADFIARATNGREGTVMVMWKRRFLFDPKNAEMQAGVY